MSEFIIFLSSNCDEYQFYIHYGQLLTRYGQIQFILYSHLLFIMDNFQLIMCKTFGKPKISNFVFIRYGQLFARFWPNFQFFQKRARAHIFFEGWPAKKVGPLFIFAAYFQKKFQKVLFAPKHKIVFSLLVLSD